jgi:hypothetical protein
MQHVIERHELLRRMAPVARLGAQRSPADHALIQVGMGAHGVEHARAILEQPGQDLVRSVNRRASSAPVALAPAGHAPSGLARGVALAHEQDVLRLRPPRHQHRHASGSPKR